MLYPEWLSLKLVSLVVGLLLVATHGWGLAAAGEAMRLARAFPRSRGWGIGLAVVAAVWTMALVQGMSLGEFEKYRTLCLLAIPALGWLSVRYLEEFLAVRGAAVVALLAAEPLLEAAFLRPETGRLLLVSLAYGWIVLGLFWVGMPYLMREQIGWATASPLRWRLAMGAGVGYGAALVVLGVMVF